jgi:hypothetical protein
MNTRRNKNVSNYFKNQRERSREKEVQKETVEICKIILEAELKVQIENLIENEIKKKYDITLYRFSNFVKVVPSRSKKIFKYILQIEKNNVETVLNFIKMTEVFKSKQIAVFLDIKIKSKR